MEKEVRKSVKYAPNYALLCCDVCYAILCCTECCAQLPMALVHTTGFMSFFSSNSFLLTSEVDFLLMLCFKASALRRPKERRGGEGMEGGGGGG